MSASNGWHWLQAKTGYVGPSDYGDVPGYVDPSDYGDVPGYVAPSEADSANGAHHVSANKAIKATPFVFGDPRQIPQREWLYGLHYARKFLSVTVAPGGSGKSALVNVEALAMATGKNLLGVLPAMPLRVWYLNGEDPMDELQRRFAAASLHHKISAEDIGDRLFINSGRDMEIVLARDDRSGIKIAAATIDALRREIRERQIDVLIIDPLVAFHNVSENDNGKINAVCRQLAMLAEETCCAIELVHHVRKPGFGQGEYTVDDARGASALLAAARSARTINTMTKNEADKADVESRKSYFRVDNGKANLAPPAENSVWHRIVSEHLWNGEHGGDSIGVVTMWNWPDPNEDVTPDDVRAVQAAVSAGEWRESSQSKKWVGYAIANALGLDIAEAAVRVKVKALLRSWLESGLLKIVERKDTTRKVRAFVEVGKKNAIVPTVEW